MLALRLPLTKESSEKRDSRPGVLLPERRPRVWSQEVQKDLRQQPIGKRLLQCLLPRLALSWNALVGVKGPFSLSREEETALNSDTSSPLMKHQSAALLGLHFVAAQAPVPAAAPEPQRELQALILKQRGRAAGEFTFRGKGQPL